MQPGDDGCWRVYRKIMGGWSGSLLQTIVLVCSIVQSCATTRTTTTTNKRRGDEGLVHKVGKSRGVDEGEKQTEKLALVHQQNVSRTIPNGDKKRQSTGIKGARIFWQERFFYYKKSLPSLALFYFREMYVRLKKLLNLDQPTDVCSQFDG